ncbi:MAG: preprotein translocase subunit SecY [Erysipelotrichaceae bacterium]|jgi:preprotein translocase subunit SecY|nr:preprotein translocase subunit SecY [Erysipelotrichaceae bacterium]MBR3150895.1 preprotein translocase subunit SecY [Erysipelotrichaceae bacterium]MCR5300325.1 preprotein translocase subunit SecY [Erysipelotrichaceae bacterium]
MVSIFADFIKNRDIRRRVLFTLAMLFIFRLGAAIPAPGINDTVIKLGANSLIYMMNLLGGGAIEQMSIFSLGVGPYINASIIIQLLSMDIIPALAEMSKNGKKGREQIDRITRYLAVVMALVQGYFIVQLLSNQYGVVDNPSPINYLYISVIFTAGTMFLLWIGDQITSKGIGNGVSIIIFAGIVANMPRNFRVVYQTLITEGAGAKGWASFIAYLIMYIAIIVLVVVMDTSERRIPIQYSTGKTINRTKGDLNHLPLKINSASVLPVIFTGALIQGPQIIASWVNQSAYAWLSDFFDFSKPYVLVIYALLVILFTFFYTNVTVDPEKIAENLGKDNTYIPGVRPGKETVEYISKVLNRITVLGSLLLAFIAVLPYIVSMATGLPVSAALGGTGIIIVVGVALETIKTLKGQLTTKQYHSFVGR